MSFTVFLDDMKRTSNRTSSRTRLGSQYGVFTISDIECGK